ncbi:hypothetical protein [Streptomyces sp. S186]|uniref:hypothetical protein n=1 Tax=Streptomyces sp. S186 TaxID=3434395 RepID=UPI003F676DF0
MSVQLEFRAIEETESAVDEILTAARAAIDLNRFPGFAEFTSGIVTIEQADSDRIVLATDNRWSATAIRTALRRAGHAVEGDRRNETTTVAVWATSESYDATQPELQLTEGHDEYGRSVFRLEGPDGMVEQQCGSGAHNELIVHARHPFPGAAHVECDRHGNDCWRRADWPLDDRIRRFIRAVLTDSGSAWQTSPEAEQRMHSFYVRHVHQTRPGASLPEFRVAIPPVAQVPVPAATSRTVPRQPTVPAPRQVDVIRDLADFEDVA